MTRERRWHFLQGAKVDKISWLSLAAVNGQAVGVLETTTGNIIPTIVHVYVSLNPSGLAPGTYSGSIIVLQDSSRFTAPVTLVARPYETTISQIADGSNWTTTILLMNADSQPAPFTIKFWQDNGQPFVVPLDGLGKMAEYSDTIQRGGLRIIPNRRDGGCRLPRLGGSSKRKGDRGNRGLPPASRWEPRL